MKKVGLISEIKDEKSEQSADCSSIEKNKMCVNINNIRMSRLV